MSKTEKNYEFIPVGRISSLQENNPNQEKKPKIYPPRIINKSIFWLPPLAKIAPEVAP